MLDNVNSVAIEGEDYTISVSDITFSLGSNISCFFVDSISDNTTESNETFVILLSSQQNEHILFQSDRAQVIIVDDEGHDHCS